MPENISSSVYSLKGNTSPEEKLKLLNEVVPQLITHFQKKADRSKHFFEFYKYASIIFAAVTSIIASLQVIYAGSFPAWILPVVSACSTVSVALLGASGAQKIWIHSRTTQQHLQTEQFLFIQKAGRYSGQESEPGIRLFSERIVELWNEGHNRWEKNVGEE